MAQKKNLLMRAGRLNSIHMHEWGTSVSFVCYRLWLSGSGSQMSLEKGERLLELMMAAQWKAGPTR